MKEKTLKFEVPGKEIEITLLGKTPIKISQRHYAYSKNANVSTSNDAKFIDDLVNAALEIKTYNEKGYDKLIKKVKYKYAVILMGERFTTVDSPDSKSRVVRTLYVNSDGAIRKVLAVLFVEEPFSAIPRVDYDISLSPGDSDFEKYVRLFFNSYYDNLRDKSEFTEFAKKFSSYAINKYFNISYVPKKNNN